MALDPRTARELALIIWAHDRNAQCERLWIAAIWRIVLDLEEGFDVPKEAVVEARLWFEATSGEWRRSREDMCGLAGIDPDELMDAYRAGRLQAAAANPVGKRRWLTRRANAAAEGRSVLSRSKDGRRPAQWNPEHPLAQAMQPKVLREKPAYLKREKVPLTR
jgi:hypothetical protein